MAILGLASIRMPSPKVPSALAVSRIVFLSRMVAVKTPCEVMAAARLASGSPVTGTGQMTAPLKKPEGGAEIVGS